MPEYNVKIKDRDYKIELARKGDEKFFEAKVNSKPVELEIEKSEIDSGSPLMLKVAGKRYEIELGKINKRAPFEVKVNNMPFQAQLREPSKKIAAKAASPQLASIPRRRQKTKMGEGVVIAPMAGKIVAVRVKKGNNVKSGDVVCILEAMKMENEIAAPKTGKIHSVKVAEGSPVNEGDTLIVIE